MSQIKEVLRLHHEAKLAYSQIGLACGLSKGAVSKYLSLAKAQGIGWPLPEGMDEAQLERRLYAEKKRSSRLVEPDFPAIHQELKRKGVTLQLLWSEYTAAHGEQAYQYSQFCFHYQRWRKRQKRSMRQIHRAGEKLFIDYCGPTVPIVDRSTGELRQAQVFVAVLGASNYTYAEATWTCSRRGPSSRRFHPPLMSTGMLSWPIPGTSCPTRPLLTTWRRSANASKPISPSTQSCWPATP